MFSPEMTKTLSCRQITQTARIAVQLARVFSLTPLNKIAVPMSIKANNKHKGMYFHQS
jgi:hypothetical protein